MNPIPMTTLSQVMNKLREKGITAEIRLDDNNEIINTETNKNVDAADLVIVKTYRFEGFSNPDDNSVLYLTKDTNGRYAFIIDAYGAYSDNDPMKFVNFLKAIKVSEEEWKGE